MMRSALLLATSALLALSVHDGARAATPHSPRLHHLLHKNALTQVPAAPRNDAPTVLYDQTGIWSGIGIVTQNFETAFDAYDCEAADDFVVPRGARWRVKGLYVMGTHFDGIGPADSENVVFYKNDHGRPGSVIVAFNGIVSPDNDGLLTIDLGKGVGLKHGHYWVSVQANENFEDSGQFGWLAFDSEVFNNPGQWRNPNDGFATGCSEWGSAKDCTQQEMLGDFKFALSGKAL